MKTLEKFGSWLAMILVVANVIFAATNFAGADVQTVEMNLARTNSMLAMIFAFLAWTKK